MRHRLRDLLGNMGRLQYFRLCRIGTCHRSPGPVLLCNSKLGDVSLAQALAFLAFSSFLVLLDASWIESIYS